MIADLDSLTGLKPRERAEDGSREISGDLKTKLLRHRHVPQLSRLHEAYLRFSVGERLLASIFGVMLFLGTLGIIAGITAAVSTSLPSRGGSLVEGVVGSARFVNPLLALSGPDKDLSALIYSGLMRATPDGDLIPDLAESIEISDDGTVYTFTLRDGLTFHDGSPLTSADVLYTIRDAQSPDIKSPRRADWEGVSISTPNTRTVIFTLPHAYAPFLENTTLGILPQSLWGEVSAEEFPFHLLNTRPVGSGPYKIDDMKISSTGSATRYELTPFSRFALGKPNLQKITFLFYPNEEELIDALNAGRVDSIAGISPLNIEKISSKGVFVVQSVLPRTFGVYFNQNNNPALSETTVRLALDAAIDKERIVAEVLKGFGVALDSPIPSRILGDSPPSTPAPLDMRNNETNLGKKHVENARNILTRGGWTYDDTTSAWKKKGVELELTIATADEPELAATAELAATMWRDAGIKVDVQIYSLSELNSTVLRPRDFQAVLFGEVIGRSLDLFAFWHSSQRNDPGLNLALYTNSKADALLSRARSLTDEEKRVELYREFEMIVQDDVPAVFLFAPEFIYLVPKRLGGVALTALTDPSERFLNAYEWYTDTERVWDIFISR